MIDEDIEEGINYYKEGDYVKSKEIFYKKYKIDKENPLVNKFIALILINEKDKKNAWKFARKALEKNPEDRENWVILAQAFLQDNKIDEAKMVVVQALKNGLNKTYVVQIEKEISRRINDLLASSSFAIKTKFIERKNKGDKNKEYFKKNTKIEPHQFEALEIKNLHNLKNYKLLEIKSKHFSKSYPDISYGWEYLGLCNIHKGKFDLALKNYQKAFEIDSDKHRLAINIITCHIELDQMEEAEKLYKKIKKDFPYIQLPNNFLKHFD